MTRSDLRKRGIDIVVHPIIIGIGEAKQTKMYSYSIFDNEEEVSNIEENPDFESYEEAEEKAVDEAIVWLQINEN